MLEAAYSVMKLLLRVVIAAALTATAILYPLQIALVPESGSFGFSTDGIANAPSITKRIVEVAPGSPADRAGLRVGDSLPLAQVDTRSRVALHYTLPGDVAVLDVDRGGEGFRKTLIAVHSAPYTLNVPDLIRAVAMFGVFAFGWLVLLRAWDTEHGPLIAAILTVTALDAAADRIPWTPQTSGPIGAALFGNVAGLDALCSALGIMLPLVLAGRLTEWRSSTLRITAASLAAYVLFVVVYCPVLVIRQHIGQATAFDEFVYDWLDNSVLFFAGAISLLIAYRTTQAESRQRVRWLVWGFCPYFFGVGLINLVAAFPAGPEWIARYPTSFAVARTAFRFLELSLPAALFYGALVRRVVDIGFVLNRVAVYGILSIAMLSVFVLLEYLVSRIFLDTNRTASLLLQLSVALGIGLSVRYLHSAADRLVDRVLFAKRHADEVALRRFAREAEAYSSTSVLLDRTLEKLRDHSDARGAAIYLAGDAAVEIVRTTSPEFPACIDSDDELLVKLRCWNDPFDTHDARTAFPDGMVFPITSRGRFVGALACQTKRDFSAFDPDERESLMQVARGLGAGLDAIGEGAGDPIAGVRESIAMLGEKIDLLPLRIIEQGRRTSPAPAEPTI